MQSLTIAVNVDLGAKIRTPYEIRYADHSGTHSVVDFAWVSVLYLVLAVGLLQPGAPPLLRQQAKITCTFLSVKVIHFCGMIL